MITDYERGKSALNVFYSFWKMYPEASKYSFDDLLTMLKSRRPMGGDVFVSGLGMGIREAGMSNGKVTEGMRKLALASNGKLPAANMNFFSYLSNESTKIDYVDAAVYVAVESAKDVVDGAAKVGDSLLTTGKILTLILPVILLVLGFIYLNRLTGGDFGKTLKGLTK